MKRSAAAAALAAAPEATPAVAPDPAAAAPAARQRRSITTTRARGHALAPDRAVTETPLLFSRETLSVPLLLATAPRMRRLPGTMVLTTLI